MIIGIQVGDTSGVAVYQNGGGNIIYAASEERFSRIKNDSDWPSMAIQHAKEVCNIIPESIEKIVLVSQRMTPMHFLCGVSRYDIQDYLMEEYEYYKPVLLEDRNRNYLDVFNDKVKKTPYKDLYELVRNAEEKDWPKIWNEWRIKKAADEFNVSPDKVTIMNHEISHAAYGVYGSNIQQYDDVLCVVYDGYGDDCNASVYVVDGGKLKQLKKYQNYNIGRLYRYITLLLGMKPNEHEFKVMGLAPYASEYIYRKPLEVFRKAYKFENGEVVIDPELKDNYFYFKERLDGMRFDGIAAGVQLLTEEMTCDLVDYWMKKTKKRKLVVSGGVALNIKANMKMGKLDCVKDLFVVGSSGDESQCIGAIFAYLDAIGKSGDIHPIKSLYLGDDVLETDVNQTVADINCELYDVISNPSNDLIANYLAKGYILGRTVGKMEFGARALGNRSILADPRKRETIDRINAKIKSRDFWMPFTPSILDDDEERFLDNKKHFKFPYMAVSCDATEEGREKLQAAIHPADKTVRPQIVTQESNEGYYNLIKAFKDITGVGALLNTSLNLHGYPIVSTAKQAMYVLDNSDLDGLILEKYLIIKKERSDS